MRRPAAVAHLVAAWRLTSQRNGTLYAAAITYFSFLALFPLLLLVVAVTGFVLHAHPAAQASLLDHISAQAPGSLGSTLRSAVRTAINARAGVGAIGLAGVLLTGLGWVANLRAATMAMWASRRRSRSFSAPRSPTWVCWPCSGSPAWCRWD
jgi:membrane protein